MDTQAASGPAYFIHTFEHRAYPLDGDGFTIGRDAASNIVVREVSVSRTHAEVRPDGADYVLHSTGATGTTLNGAPLLTDQPLREGDRVGVGTMTFTFTRARLPLGVSIVSRATRLADPDDVATKRPTISHPILPPMEKEKAPRRGSWSWVAIIVVIAIIAVGYSAFVVNAH